MCSTIFERDCFKLILEVYRGKMDLFLTQNIDLDTVTKNLC